MSESTKATLCLIAIAVLVAFAQTADYNDQQQALAAEPTSDYIAWRKEMLAATQDTWTREEREEYVSRWKQENPELAPIISTRWHEPKSQKVAQK